MKAIEPWFLTSDRMGASTNKGATNAAIAAGIRYHKRMYKTFKLQCAINFPEWKLMIEPWFRTAAYKLRSPDSVLVDEAGKRAIVIEVKKNWQDGRDVKLLDEYLPIVQSALGVKTYPLMVVGNVRGLKHAPLLSFKDILLPLDWKPGMPTPTLLAL